MTLELPMLPAQQGFSEAGQQFLDAIYSSRQAGTDSEKISALTAYMKKGELIVTSYSGEDSEKNDLLALEYFVLIENGFNE